MPFCPNCGNKINDKDKFCYQCGKDLRINTDGSTTPIRYTTQNSGGPVDGKARLSVCCLASSASASVNVLPNDPSKKGTIIKAGQTGIIEYEPGDYVITYVVDRGPGLTFVASRITRYQKRLTFHPGETITMDANVGRQMTQVNYQSSLGFQILS